MKILISAILLFSIITTSAQAQKRAFVIDAKASQLTWTGYSEVGSWAPSGTVQIQKGQFVQTGSQISTGSFVIDMATIQHENGQMQEHLRGDDFFGVTRFPSATFVLRSLTGGTATGQLTIRGITKPVSFPVVVSQEGTGLRVKGKATIDRTQFNIHFNSSSFFQNLGNQAIKNEFTLAFDVVARPGATSKQHEAR